MLDAPKRVLPMRGESGRLKAIEGEGLFFCAESDGATKGYCERAWVNRDISIVFTASQ